MSNSKLEQLQQLLRNYEELATDLDDDAAYVARGNGFCDAKYSDNFIEGQIASIKQQIAQLKNKQNQ